jgi:hypothetical protein
MEILRPPDISAISVCGLKLGERRYELQFRYGMPHQPVHPPFLSFWIKGPGKSDQLPKVQVRCIFDFEANPDVQNFWPFDAKTTCVCGQYLEVNGVEILFAGQRYPDVLSILGRPDYVDKDERPYRSPGSVVSMQVGFWNCLCLFFDGEPGQLRWISLHQPGIPDYS